MKKIFLFILIVTGIFLSACSSSTRFTGKDIAPTRRGVKNIQKKDDKRTFSDVSSLKTIRGIASYYGSEFNGNQTASGEIFNMNDLTAAHREFPFNTVIKVTNLDNNKSVIIRINDRGPFNQEREIDISLGAAKILDIQNSGTAKVQLDVLKWGN
jgi:rare lipoprotein A